MSNAVMSSGTSSATLPGQLLAVQHCLGSRLHTLCDVGQLSPARAVWSANLTTFLAVVLVPQEIKAVLLANAANKSAGKQLLRELPLWQRLVAHARSWLLLLILYATFWVSPGILETLLLLIL